MDFFQVLESRRSMRNYAARPVEEEKLQRILQAVCLAPSAGNLQAFAVYIVRRLEQRQALVHAAFDQEFIAEAPIVLVFCAEPERSAVKYGERGATLYALQDATIACTYAMLAAKALDLDSVWIGAFDEREVSRLLGLPPGHRPVAMLPIGYAGKETRPRPRRPLEEWVNEV
ncbi:MAG: nitroreductase family protein [Anaerolineales bacterium]|nr:nitroreductase family protein [Anaerolineales bacterium]MDW8226610.1 nitroreductase family protein [Anaerolineales bacterium]